MEKLLISERWKQTFVKICHHLSPNVTFSQFEILLGCHCLFPFKVVTILATVSVFVSTYEYDYVYVFLVCPMIIVEMNICQIVSSVEMFLLMKFSVTIDNRISTFITRCSCHLYSLLMSSLYIDHHCLSFQFSPTICLFCLTLTDQLSFVNCDFPILCQ